MPGAMNKRNRKILFTDGKLRYTVKLKNTCSAHAALIQFIPSFTKAVVVSFEAYY